jgi:hypothetical protein
MWGTRCLAERHDVDQVIEQIGEEVRQFADGGMSSSAPHASSTILRIVVCAQIASEPVGGDAVDVGVALAGWVLAKWAARRP